MIPPELQEVLSWANMVRVQTLHMEPIDTLPKGIPGNSQHCCIARCWQVQEERTLREAHFHGKPLVRVGRVQVSSSGSRVEIAWARYPTDPPRFETKHIDHPFIIGKFIEAFDNSEYPELIDCVNVKPMVTPQMVQQMQEALSKKAHAAMEQHWTELSEKLLLQGAPFGLMPPLAMPAPKAPVTKPPKMIDASSLMMFKAIEEEEAISS